MHTLKFIALGTHWQIKIDQSSSLPSHLHSDLVRLISEFEKTYSRFLPDSLISHINQGQQSSFVIPSELSRMLSLGQRLNHLTQGRYNLNIAATLEAYGYDADYSFRPLDRPPSLPKSHFKTQNHHLYITGPVKLDLGSLGKGYLIDKIAHFLQQKCLPYFLINGGGDIFATSKADGHPWQVALEHPLNPSLAFAQLQLHHQAIASSAPHRRQVGQFHHLLNFQTQKPVKHTLSLIVLADSALLADASATALFVTPHRLHQSLARRLKIHFLTVSPNLDCLTSPHFPVRIFTC